MTYCSVNHVEISAQESVYLILQLAITKSSRATIFVNTSPPEERVYLLKSMDSILQLEDESEEVTATGLIHRYAERPQNMSAVTLAEYAAFYDQGAGTFKQKSKVIDNDGFLHEVNDEDCTDDYSEPCTKNDNVQSVGLLRRRKKARVIRSVWFNPELDGERHFRELLMLFTPWRNEEKDLIGSCLSFAEAYQKQQHDIERLLRQFSPYHSDMTDIVLSDFNGDDCEEIGADIAPNSEYANQEAICSQKQIIPLNPEMDLTYDIGEDLGLNSYTGGHDETFHKVEMADNEYRESVRCMNHEQMSFFLHVLYQIKTGQTPIYYFLSGGAGVGKSFVTRNLYQSLLKHFNSRPGDDFKNIEVIVGAPTGKAAFISRGRTLHDIFEIPSNQKMDYKPLSSNRLNTLRNKIGSLKVVIIDEISMVGAKMFHFIHRRLQEVKGNSSDFGGVSVIAVGDLFQLQPVFDSWIFTNIEQDYAQLSTNLWMKHVQLFELTTIMRQKDCKQFAELLNRLREGNQTLNDIGLLQQRVVSWVDSYHPENVLHLFTTNKKVNAFNEEQEQKAKGPKFQLNAIDSVLGTYSNAARTKLLSMISTDPRKTMQLAHKLVISIGTRTEICINVDTSDGITNGASNVVECVDASSDNPIIWVKFDELDIGKSTRQRHRNLYTRSIPKHWTPIFPVSRQFTITQKVTVVRRQLPLRLSASKTVHRAQGTTVEEIVLDLSGRKTNHLHYVALSRVTALQGVFIQKLSPKTIATSTTVKDEMRRLRSQMSVVPVEIYSHPADNQILFMFMNATSAYKYLPDIRRQCSLFEPHVYIVAESRFKPEHGSEAISILGYSLLRNDHRQPQRGLAIYYKDTWSVNNVSNLNTEPIW